MKMYFNQKNDLKKSLLGIGLATLLFAPLTTLTGCHSERLADLTPEEKREDTTHTPKGVRVVLEMEDTSTGTTRTITGDHDYSFTELGKGGTIQAQGHGFKEAEGHYMRGAGGKVVFIAKPIKVQLTFHAQGNVVFQGWSWRYAEDPKGTHRDKAGKILSDYISTPALQPIAGVKELDINESERQFKCEYRPGTKNIAYVKVKYHKKLDPRSYSPKLDLALSTGFDAHWIPSGLLLEAGYTGTEYRKAYDALISGGQGLPHNLSHLTTHIVKSFIDDVDYATSVLRSLYSHVSFRYSSSQTLEFDDGTGYKVRYKAGELADRLNAEYKKADLMSKELHAWFYGEETTARISLDDLDLQW